MTPRAFNRRLRRALRASEREFDALVRAYQEVLAEARRIAVSAVEEHSTVIVAASDAKFRPPDPDEILPRGKLEKAVADATNATRAKVARTVAAPFDVGIAFDVGGVFNEQLLAMAGARAADLADAARESVQSVIREALDGGFSVPETAKAIGERLAEITDTTATMLARTDLIGTQNGASVAAARAVFPEGNLVKTWQSTYDDRTRPTHEEADGQQVPLDQPFTVGGFQLDYPGDPSGPDEEVINCRCTVLYEEVAAVTASVEIGYEPLMQIRVYDKATGETVDMVSGPALTMGGEMSATETETTEAATGAPWSAVLAVEDARTEDGRLIAPGALSWRELPLTLMAMVETTEGGHLGAEVAGRIDTIERVGNDIVATGVFDAGQYGQDIERLVRDQTLRGVSVDLAVLDYEIRDAETDEPLTEEQAIDAWLEGRDTVFVILDGVIGAATVCPFQAIEGATIEVVASAALVVKLYAEFAQPDELTASAAGLAPVKPPAGWLAPRKLAGPTPWTVTDDGECFGHLALWSTCHVAAPGGPGVCTTAPPSPSDYAHFHLGEIVCDDGTRRSVGTITLGTGHAALGIDPRSVLAHYDDTGTAVADVIAWEDEHGIAVAGALRPDVPASRVRTLRGAKLSGDWRKVGGALDLVAILAVNTPGFPVPRSEALVAAADADTLALVAAGLVDASTDDEIAEVLAWHDVDTEARAALS